VTTYTARQRRKKGKKEEKSGEYLDEIEGWDPRGKYIRGPSKPERG